MNIDIEALTSKAIRAYHERRVGGEHLSLCGMEGAVQAVLAEVAKHNTPDKPAYFKTGERPPTKGDADEGGYVLAWCIGNPKRIRWSDAQWDVDVRDFPDIYPFWTLMPPKPPSEDDAAFESFASEMLASGKWINAQSVQARKDAREVWDAALAHRNKSKP